jgi:hypothetical protein
MPLMFNGDGGMPYGGVVGATAMNGGIRMAQLTNLANDEANIGAMLHFNSRASIPDGTRHPVAWVMPRVAGGLSARNTIIGSGSLAATAQSGQNIAATLTGSGGISGPIGLIVTIAATITGSGGVSSATTQALATLVATLSGTGNITAAAAGLAALQATLTGSGSVTANNTALAQLGATIRGYGDATAEGIRDAVWAAAAAENNAAGTMGQKLNLAGSGGVDNDALAAAVWAHVTRTLTGITNANVQQVNGQNIDGTGTELDPWGPA